ncbi:hypothetical protein CHOED_082 [Vibrio phage CHOED]|uniref:hypothetical protein n=1 Tax=Vibrio phage CHOED TaxID=1458716 RepID=UPI00042E1EDC|nr:hypothetical protein CHOED_082 [Vibrio phage CHOED]AHK11942.1 hypothetical protein CHOED_082 [Vibrio phage CHOED]
MICTARHQYKAMCDYARTHNNPELFVKLKEFREANGLHLEPLGYTDFNAALSAIFQREARP